MNKTIRILFYVSVFLITYLATRKLLLSFQKYQTPEVVFAIKHPEIMKKLVETYDIYHSAADEALIDELQIKKENK